MSYSVSNVFTEAGLANVLRWVPFDINESNSEIESATR